MLAEWVPFIIWCAVLLGVTLALKITLTTLLSSLSVGFISADAALIFFMPYTVDCETKEIPATRLVETGILLISGIYLVFYIIYQVLRDNKHRRFCHYCRRRNDITPPQYYDIVRYDNPAEDSDAIETADPLLKQYA